MSERFKDSGLYQRVTRLEKEGLCNLLKASDNYTDLDFPEDMRPISTSEEKSGKLLEELCDAQSDSSTSESEETVRSCSPSQCDLFSDDDNENKYTLTDVEKMYEATKLQKRRLKQEKQQRPLSPSKQEPSTSNFPMDLTNFSLPYGAWPTYMSRDLQNWLSAVQDSNIFCIPSPSGTGTTLTRIRPQSPVSEPVPQKIDNLQPILEEFERGIIIKHKRNANKSIKISKATPGFDRATVTQLIQDGDHSSSLDVIKSVYMSQGKWTLMKNMYQLE